MKRVVDISIELIIYEGTVYISMYYIIAGRVVIMFTNN